MKRYLSGDKWLVLAYYYAVTSRGVAQLARAQVSKTWCRGFESLHPCQINLRKRVFYLLAGHQLFETPRYDRAENEIVDHLMEYMTEEFLDAGVSVVFDTNAIKKGQRRVLRDIARKKKAQHVLVWLQIDPDSAFARVSQRDRRKNEDKHAQPLDRPLFDEIAARMQNPGHDEDYIVLSGKHSYPMQRTAIVKKLYDLKLIKPESVSANVVKPGLVNLVPTAGRVDMTRRNITIR